MSNFTDHLRPAHRWLRNSLFGAALCAWLSACVGSGSGTDPNNDPPEFTTSSIAAASSVLMPGEEMALSVRASDPNGDDLTYTWSEESAAGTFTGDGSAAATWKAPDAEGTYTLVVTVADPSGEQVALRHTVTVAATLQVPSAPYPTIQSALDIARPGMTVSVAAGTYREDLTLKETVLLHGEGAAVTIVEGTGTGPVIEPDFARAPGTTVEGFTFTKGSVGVDIANTADFTLRDCIVRDNSGAGIELFATPALIESCRITGNSGSGLDIRSSAATVQGCVIADNAGDGLELASAPTLLRFCTIADNVGVGIRLFESNAEVEDSIIAANDGDSFNTVTLLGATGVSFSSSRPLFANVLLYHNEFNVDDNHVPGARVIVDGTYITGENPVLADPDPLLSGADDYTLQPTSLALDLASDGGELGAYGGGFAPPSP